MAANRPLCMGNARGVKRDFEALERRRFQALKLLQQGYNQSEVARRVKVCSQTVSRWARAVQAQGEQALETVGRAGPQASAGSGATPAAGGAVAGRAGETWL